ncbi:hypothetical protein ACKI1Q_42620 [Streptomyces galilaeus]|uniref:hypothetical protein n=1 Tax=Streptomyces galilaeus TaxID=33899 RepID=UPI0038F7762F
MAAVAAQARGARRGLWASDVTTAGARITGLASLTDDVVILPKLFRRTVDLRLSMPLWCYPPSWPVSSRYSVLSTGERRADPAEWSLVGGGGGRAVEYSAVGRAKLRLDAVDALEAHYGPSRDHQPLQFAHAARDELLKSLGFVDVQRQPDETVTATTRKRFPASSSHAVPTSTAAESPGPAPVPLPAPAVWRSTWTSPCWGRRSIGLHHIVEVTNGHTVRMTHQPEDLVFEDA